MIEPDQGVLDSLWASWWGWQRRAEAGEHLALQKQASIERMIADELLGQSGWR